MPFVLDAGQTVVIEFEGPWSGPGFDDGSSVLSYTFTYEG